MHKKTLISNILSLMLVQGVNYLVPIVTLPLLVKSLGVIGYGKLAFYLAFINYFILLTDFGFNLSASREISLFSDCKEKVSEIFFNVLLAKLILCFLSLSIVFFMVFIIHSFYLDVKIILSIFLMVVGTVFFPQWLFQGLEKIKQIAVISAVPKLIMLPFIYFFVKSEDDVWLAGLSFGLAYLFSGLLGLCLVFKLKLICLSRISLAGIIHQLQNSLYLFLSAASVNLYTSSTVVLLGLISGDSAVGYFAAADKIRMAVQGLIAPVSQVVYPRVSNLVAKDVNLAKSFLFKLFRLQSISCFILSIILFVFSQKLIVFMYGFGYDSSITVLHILSILPFIVGMSNVLGVQILLTFGYKKEFSQILCFGGVINLLMITPLAYFFNESGAAFSIVITESVIAVIMAIMVKLKAINIIRYINEI